MTMSVLLLMKCRLHVTVRLGSALACNAVLPDHSYCP